MKYLKSLLATALVAIAGVGFTGCNEDLEIPPLSIPASDWKANTTIADFKAQYWSDQENYCTKVGLTTEGEHVILGGRVIGNDQTGNIYQAIQIQDETGAITISASVKSLYLRYKIGEQVFIDVTDLYAGKYAGLFQIGTEGTYNSAPTTSKMTEDQFLAHTQINGLPEPSLVEDKVLTIPQINAMVNNTADVMLYQSQRIRINDVSFVGGGKELWADAGSSGADRYLIDKDGNRLLVRNSGYSDFCDQTLPAGHGDIIAILSWYRSSWQVLFITPDDCIDFGGESYAPGGGEAIVSSLDETFEGCSSITDLGNWSAVDVQGKATWFTYTYGGTTFVSCTAYNKTAGDNGYESWLITPGLDLDKMAEKVCSFNSMVGYSGQGTLEVFILSSNDPKTATATKLDANIPQPTGSWSDWVPSGNINLSAFSGVVYLGFRYTAAVATGYTTYRVDNVVAGKKVDGSSTETPSTGATFTKATSLTSGDKYAFVVDGKLGTTIAQTVMYGRLGMTAISISGDSFTADPVNALTITASGNAYTIVDTYGRYYGMDDSHLSTFQLYNTNSGDGCLWNITIEADGTATISNVLHPECHLVRSGTFENIAPSDIVTNPEFTAPVLYRMAN